MAYNKKTDSKLDEKIIPLLPHELSEKLKNAGIPVTSQNDWFAPRESKQGVSLGVEFEIKNGVVFMYATDWIAEQINNRFRDQLYKAYGMNWRLVGTNGKRDNYMPYNPVYGTYQVPKDNTAKARIAVVQEGLNELDKWVHSNSDAIINSEYISAVRSLGKAMIETISRKEKEAEGEKLARYLSAG